jgi:hypothetical protein
VTTYQKNKTPEAAEVKRERQAEAAREGRAAMAEYQADILATREKTAKLRALRLAQEAKIAQQPKAAAPQKKVAVTGKKPVATSSKKPVAAKKPAVRKAASR